MFVNKTFCGLLDLDVVLCDLPNIQLIGRYSGEDEMAELLTVDAHEDVDWDGSWVRCPHCEHENGITV